MLSPLTMFLTTTILLAQLSAAASYTLVDEYANQNFFDGFTFFTDPDPTEGHVKYVDRITANQHSLAGVLTNYNNSVYMGLDWNGPSGIPNSVRLTSKKSYTKGLFVADILHMPGSTCGVWPAFWLLGPNWPAGGEIDILEGINDGQVNHMTLHTSSSPGCKIASPSGNNTKTPAKFTGKLATTDCETSIGCKISTTDPKSYGTGFNQAGGGIYAVIWTSQEIAIHFFSRNAIPADLSPGSRTPDPSKWGLPAAHFSAGPGACDIDAHFKEMQIVINTSLCGQWAGKEWNKTESSCLKLAPTCDEFVSKNPGEFKDAFWAINSVRVFQ